MRSKHRGAGAIPAQGTMPVLWSVADATVLQYLEHAFLLAEKIKTIDANSDFSTIKTEADRINILLQLATMIRAEQVRQ